MNLNAECVEVARLPEEAQSRATFTCGDSGPFLCPEKYATVGFEDGPQRCVLVGGQQQSMVTAVTVWCQGHAMEFESPAANINF